MTALAIVEILEYCDIPLAFLADDEAGNLHLADSTSELGAPGKGGVKWGLTALDSPITESVLFPDPGYTVEGPWNSHTLLLPGARPLGLDQPLALDRSVRSGAAAG